MAYIGHSMMRSAVNTASARRVGTALPRSATLRAKPQKQESEWSAFVKWVKEELKSRK